MNNATETGSRPTTWWCQAINLSSETSLLSILTTCRHGFRRREGQFAPGEEEYRQLLQGRLWGSDFASNDHDLSKMKKALQSDRTRALVNSHLCFLTDYLPGRSFIV